VFVWPLFGALVSSLWLPSDTSATSRDNGRAFILWVFSAPTVMILLPLAIVLFSAVGLSAEGGAGLAVTVTFAAWMLVPQVELLSEGRRLWPALLALLAAIGALGAGAVTMKQSAGEPRPSALLYVLDQDAGNAFWSARTDRPDAWLASYLGSKPRPGRPEAIVPPWFSATTPAGFLHAPAPVAELASPSAELLGSSDFSDGRELHLRLKPGVAGHLLTLWISDVSVWSAELDGRNATPAPASQRSWFGLSYSNAPAAGLELKLRVKGRTPLKLIVIDWGYGMPPMSGGALSPRPASLPQANRGDQTLVRRVFVF
jgi:hypothetical protein